MENNIYQDIKLISQELKSEVVSFARKLIQTPSISGSEYELSCILLDEMKKLGYDEYFRDDQGNIVGIINGEEDGPTIMYNSHMDHVGEGNLENWRGYDPYGGKIDICEVDDSDGTKKEMTECIHGRGASDVKGGEASQVYAGGVLVRLKKMGYKFKGKFMFTGVVMEEPAEMVGMKHLIEKTLPSRGLTYDAMITSEASSLKIYCGHRGRVEILVTVYGRTCHGSTPWSGINAIYKAIPLICMIKDDLSKSLPEDEKLGRASISLNIIECSPGALSIVPDKCMLSIDRHLIPGETPNMALKQIQSLIDEISSNDAGFKADAVIKSSLEKSYTGVEYEVPKIMEPWKISQGHGFVKSAAAAIESVGQKVKYGYWYFGTDASKTAGIDKKPTIGYSPMQEQYAHSPYDKVRIDYIVKSIAGNTAIFIKASEGDSEIFKLL
ncbi:MAG: M20/M25/M40 family metallo-hydrolase [Clostridium sp.]|uniref:M20/M25/M40 family metallo-hydrolase n=1 Tax=Clostridium sp. TaxID=1506 RepID=UPI0025BADDAB|nr:M20/M25/M40 family metallo-hydrolase [Clostridium sp.]MCH3965744.1 M20/M25/M40 family metallo-hydrolase [Clostridium sp.]MCI1717153.1 M20/M25/M40 family metallo-hydrolase [Clostridium sp.]MCI1801493.1 M20/M25/M40 family metallo-hydrolase [Clostridium sp.]MCI1815376.1 M20/M25/M40 family metallo-hydrolase [Clostridium sp.]MCI1872279.1 M20/M25/M40 family metallo-hydrolase [Clostridium sp.]